MLDRVLRQLGAVPDRLLASDPGLGRLRTAFNAVFALGSSLAVEYLVARLIGADARATLVSLLLGAVVAMMGSMALTGPGVWRKVKLAVFFPVAVGVGMVGGAAAGSHTTVMLTGFVAVMFVAVFVRRFGIPFFFYGFMAWMGYFFASFLQATLAVVPSLLVAVLVSSVWVLVLSVTVLRTDARRVLGSTWRAYDARGRAVARAAAELLEHRGDSRRRGRWQRRLSAREAGLAEAALMIEGWSEEQGALPAGWSGAALRRRLLDSQQALDRVIGSAVALQEADPELVGKAVVLLDRIARFEPGARRLAAIAAAEQLADAARAAEARGHEGWWQARHLAFAAIDLIDLAGSAGEPPEVEPTDAEYSATTPLMMGNLPGAPAVARDVPARGIRWNPLARMDLTSRQALQAALAGAIAIVAGRALSPTRYYWAVIAAFVVFTGTATRSETFLKALNRVVGTLVGLVVAIWLAHLTSGHTAWVLTVVLLSMFLGFYLLRLSYAYMMFFITIMVGQLYTVLNMFSSELLVLRLEETAIGAAVGIAVALAVTPLSTRDTVKVARDSLLEAVRDLLEGVADRLTEDESRPDLDGLSRAVDNRVRQLVLVAQPLTRPMLLGNDSRHTRHRLALYRALGARVRALVVGLRRTRSVGSGTAYAAAGMPGRSGEVTAPGDSVPGDDHAPPVDDRSVAEACRALARAAEELTAAAPGKATPALVEPLGRADTAVFTDHDDARSADPVRRALVHLHSTLAELADPAGARAAGH
ncbi:MAG TPA: FUSC family protein [Nocardioidaceae bacterium]|nr:FUSC family protein [Nocardioidaceae bacterium]